MEIKHQSSNIKSSGNVEKHDFKITASAKAFSILSSNIYQDKVQAIIRELSCNAVDAHVAAGHNKPFDVKLPTLLFQQFEIRDYGTGLSHEDMMELYTTYFESTKTDSNLFVGALGLGSKSPFSYTKTFTVQSYFNGTVRTYQAFMDGGVPAIALATTEETTEPNGLRVIVPVKADDADNRWVRAAKYVYRTFDKIRPNVDCDIDYLEFNNDGVAALTLNSKPAKQFYVVMGGVQYPVEFELVIGEKKPTFSELFKNTITFLKVPIGSVDIEPGREGLSYDKKTIDYLNLAIDRVENIIKDRIVRDIKNESSLRLAAVKQHKILNKINSIRGTLNQQLYKHAVINISYDGVSLSFRDNVELCLAPFTHSVGAHSNILGLTVCRSDANTANAELVMSRLNQNTMPVQTIIETPKNIMIINKTDNGASPERLIKAMRNKLRVENKLDQYSHFLVVTNSQADDTTYGLIDILCRIFRDEHTIVKLNKDEQASLIGEYFDVKVDGIDTPAVRSGSVSKTNIEIKSVTTLDSGEVVYKHCSSDYLNRTSLDDLIESYIADGIPVLVYGAYRNNYVPICHWETHKTSSKTIMSEGELMRLTTNTVTSYEMPEAYVILAVKADLMPALLELKSKVLCFDTYIREQLVDKIKELDTSKIPSIIREALCYDNALAAILGEFKADSYSSEAERIKHIVETAKYDWDAHSDFGHDQFVTVISWIKSNNSLDRAAMLSGTIIDGAKAFYSYRMVDRAPLTIKALCEPLKKHNISKAVDDYAVLDEIKIIIKRLNWCSGLRYNELLNNCQLLKTCNDLILSDRNESYKSSLFKFIADNDYELFVILCGLSERHFITARLTKGEAGSFDAKIAARVSKVLENF